MTDAMYIILHTGCLYFDTRKKEAAQEDSSVLHCIPSSTMHEICTQDKRDMVKYVDISQAGNPNSYNRSMMTWCLC